MVTMAPPGAGTGTGDEPGRVAARAADGRGWFPRRSLVRARLLLALSALSLIGTTLLTGILGTAQRDSIAAVRDYLQQTSQPDRVVQIATSLAADPDAQAARERRVAGQIFGDLPVQSFRRLTSLPMAVTGSGVPTDSTVRLSAYDDLPAHVSVIAGNWPAPPVAKEITPVAVRQDLAASWSLQVGQQVTVRSGAAGDRVLLVAAVVQPSDDSDFFVADRTLLQTAQAASAVPALIVAPEVLTAGGRFSAAVQWTYVPDATRLDPGQVSTLLAAVRALPAAVRNDFAITINGALVDGGLDGSLSTLQSSLDAAIVAQPLPLLLVLALCLVMMLQIGRLLAADRRSETALLTARGLAAPQAARWSAVEAAVFAGIGAWLGQLLVRMAVGPTPAGWWIRIGAVLVAVVACVWPTWRDASARLLRERWDDAGRGRGLIAWAVVTVLLLTAGFAVWRFRRSGADAVTTIDGKRVLDPAVLLAPAITVVALAAVGSVLFQIIAGSTARSAARRSSGIASVMPARQVARRQSVFGTAVLLVALAVGVSVVAAGYVSTAADQQLMSARLTNGPDVRVAVPAADLSPNTAFADPAARYAGQPGVTNAVAVSRLEVTAGDTAVALVGMPRSRLTALLPSGPDFSAADTARWLAGSGQPGGVAPTADEPGVEVPENATEVGLRLTVDRLQREGTGAFEFGGTLWFGAAGGAVIPAALGEPREPSWGERSTLEFWVGLPAGHAPLRLLAMDLRFPDASGVTAVTVAAMVGAGQGAAAAPLALPSGTAGDPAFGDTAFTLTQDGGTVRAQRDPQDAARIVTSLDRTLRLVAAPAGPVPVVVNQSLARTLQLAVGDAISMDTDGGSLPTVVTGIVTRIPGVATGDGAIADSARLSAAVLRASVSIPRPSEIWLATGDPAAVAGAAAAIAGPAATVTTVGSDSVAALLRPAVRALWWGTIGALLLAVLAVMLVTATLARARRSELAVLRAMGVGALAQARMRTRELWMVVGPGWLFGLLAGFGAAVLVVPGLARQAVPTVADDSGVARLGADPPLSLAWAPWLLLLAAHAVAVALVIAWHSRAITVAARRADPREVIG